MTNPDIKVGDVCHDLVKDGKVQVVEKAADTVADHQEFNDYDVQSYKANTLLEPADDEPVFRCVYLPDQPSTSFTGTYDLPRSRLARVPIEEAHDDLDRPQHGVAVQVLRALITAGRQFDGSDHCPGPKELAEESVLPADVVDAAVEFAQVDQQFAEADDD